MRSHLALNGHRRLTTLALGQMLMATLDRCDAAKRDDLLQPGDIVGADTGNWCIELKHTLDNIDTDDD